MPSKIEVLITDEIYHIYNRGVDKRVVFNDKPDFLRFYNCLHLFNTIEPVINYRLATGPKTQNDTLVNVIAYALLPNHFHLILKQNVDNGISEFMKRMSAGYTSYFNQKNERTGSLFQGRFKRKCIITDEYLNYLLSYVNENSTVHGICMPDDVCYSSSAHYSGTAKSKLIKESVGSYLKKDAQLLAQDIYKKRLLSKSVIFE